MRHMNHVIGNEVFFADDWLVPRNEKGQFVKLEKLKCPECGKLATKEGYDPCLGKLPGVLAACCGHNGKGHNHDGTGYILFKNGVKISGHFTSIKKFKREGKG